MGPLDIAVVIRSSRSPAALIIYEWEPLYSLGLTIPLSKREGKIPEHAIDDTQ
jgi:hypothetical protein